jgi:hypothetical protein
VGLDGYREGAAAGLTRGEVGELTLAEARHVELLTAL